MATAAVTAEREHYLNQEYGIRSWLLTTDHKRIALLYLISITFFFFVGGFFALFDERIEDLQLGGLIERLHGIDLMFLEGGLDHAEGVEARFLFALHGGDDVF